MEASDVRRLKELEEKHIRLKQMYANLSLGNQALKDVFAKVVRRGEKRELVIYVCIQHGRMPMQGLPAFGLSSSVSELSRHKSNCIVFESYPELGYNYRMTDIKAAVGREQLKRLPAVLERRRELAQRYLDALGGHYGLVMPEQPVWARSNWQSFSVGLPDTFDQVSVLQGLMDRGVSARRGVMCVHREHPRGTAWKCATGDCSCEAFTCASLAVSEMSQDRCVILPLYPQMTDDDQDRVVGALIDILTAG